MRGGLRETRSDGGTWGVGVRAQGGVTSKKASREQATLTVNLITGLVVLTVLGKNGMMWRPEDDQPWTHLPRTGTAQLRTHSEFSLLGRVGA